MGGAFWIASILCGAMVGFSYARWQGLKPAGLTIGIAICGLLALPRDGGTKNVLSNGPQTKYRAIGICFAAIWVAINALPTLV